MTGREAPAGGEAQRSSARKQNFLHPMSETFALSQEDCDSETNTSGYIWHHVVYLRRRVVAERRFDYEECFPAVLRGVVMTLETGLDKLEDEIGVRLEDDEICDSSVWEYALTGIGVKVGND